jgi:hypothetical protein
MENDKSVIEVKGNLSYVMSSKSIKEFGYTTPFLRTGQHVLPHKRALKTLPEFYVFTFL